MTTDYMSTQRWAQAGRAAVCLSVCHVADITNNKTINNSKLTASRRSVEQRLQRQQTDSCIMIIINHHRCCISSVSREAHAEIILTKSGTSMRSYLPNMTIYFKFYTNQLMDFDSAKGSNFAVSLSISIPDVHSAIAQSHEASPLRCVC